MRHDATRRARRDLAPSRLLLLDARLARALEVIERRLAVTGTGDSYAAVTGCSLAHLRARFRGALGEPLGSYARRVRLERAAAALRSTRQSVLEIALGSGFDSHEGFSRAFRRAFGLSPRDFRRETREPCRPETGERRTRGIDVRLVQRPALRIAFVRYVGPAPLAWIAWSRLLELARTEGIARPGAMCVGIRTGWEPAGGRQHLRYDAGITVSAGFQPNGELSLMEIAGGQDAVTAYAGMAPGLADRWRRFAGDWLPHSGYACRDDRVFEVYRTPAEPWRGPRRVSDHLLGDIEADLHIPVRRGRLAALP